MEQEVFNQDPETVAPMKDKKADYYWVDLSRIEVEEGFNVRFDYGDIAGLAAEILAQGQRNSAHGFTRRGSDKITLTDGHRRYAAVKLLHSQGHTHVRFKIEMEGRNPSETDRILGLLSYNTGKPLAAIEEAEVYNRLINKCGWSVQNVADKVGKSHTHIDNLMKLIGISDELRQLIIKGQVSATTVIEQLQSAKGDDGVVETKVKKAIAENNGKKVSNKHIDPKPKAKDNAAIARERFDGIMNACSDKTLTAAEIAAQPVGSTSTTVYVPYDVVLALMRAEFNQNVGGG